MNKPSVGQIWERHGERREVFGMSVLTILHPHEECYWIYWNRPGEKTEFYAWLPAWNKWQDRAKLIKGD